MTLALALTVLLGLLLLAWAALDEPAVQAWIVTAFMLVMFGRPVGRRRRPPYVRRHGATTGEYAGRHAAATA